MNVLYAQKDLNLDNDILVLQFWCIILIYFTLSEVTLAEYKDYFTPSEVILFYTIRSYFILLY